MNITVYQKQRSKSLDDFIEACVHADLCYYASDLVEAGLCSAGELHEAIGRALKICSTLQLATSAHFKLVYIYRNNELSSDWLLSSIGRKLVMLNAAPENPVVAKIQLEFLRVLE